MLHRGRIQAQGGGVEESVSWSRNTPLSKEEGLHKIDTLENILPPNEAKMRAHAFEKARVFVIKAADNGGIDAQVSKSCRVKGTKDIRIDIEIITGKAFIS
ncbi:MAG: hypothetical protein KAH77_12325 [Thiomargarita sp.]|nr:hypothetical protein [Thiomargarita sp.]